MWGRSTRLHGASSMGLPTHPRDPEVRTTQPAPTGGQENAVIGNSRLGPQPTMLCSLPRKMPKGPVESPELVSRPVAREPSAGGPG